MLRRTRDPEEERTRTLYVRLPHTIRNLDDVKSLFKGDFKIKQPRQSARHCHVIFQNVGEKLKALESAKGKEINGKRVLVCNPKPRLLEKKLKQKKVVIPKPEAPPKFTQTLFISNIKDGTKIHEIINAFPGCKRAMMLGPNKKNLRSAFVKMERLEMAEQLLKKECEWPTVRGHKLFVRADSRKPRNGRRAPRGRGLKVWDGENEIPFEYNQSTDQQQSEDENDDEESGEDEDEADVSQIMTKQE